VHADHLDLSVPYLSVSFTTRLATLYLTDEQSTWRAYSQWTGETVVRYARYLEAATGVVKQVKQM
jgi:hypothetical protein